MLTCEILGHIFYTTKIAIYGSEINREPDGFICSKDDSIKPIICRRCGKEFSIIEYEKEKNKKRI